MKSAISADSDAVSAKVSPHSVGKDNDKEEQPYHADNALELQSHQQFPSSPNNQSDRFQIVKNKLKQNTPAVQALPTTRRNPRDVGNLLIIVFLSVLSCCSVLYFISPLAIQARTQQQSSTTSSSATPLLVYFVVSGSVPIQSSLIINSYSKYIDSGSMTDEADDPSTPKTDLVIQFANNDLNTLQQITRTLLSDDLMKIGVASAKIRASATVTLLCSSLFISEYCGQTWSFAGCPTGMTGVACDECLPNRYGADCQPCPTTCSPNGVCDGVHGVGKCICESGWTGPSCNLASST